MIIGLAGYAQSGKDTVAEILINRFGYKRVAFADKLKEFAYDTNPIVGYVAGEPITLKHVVDRAGWESAKTNTNIRRYLQDIGLAARNHFSQTFWVDQAMRQVTDLKVVITDVRFINEADTIRLNGGQIWRIQRPGVGAVNGHVSESQMDNYPVDQTFVNDGSIEDLENLIVTRMRGYVLG